MAIRLRYKLYGVVQGIGLRPFIHSLSVNHGLLGSVRNTSECVILEWQGQKNAINSAFSALFDFLQSFGRLRYDYEEIAKKSQNDFSIYPSKGNQASTSLLAPDTAPCEQCLQELFQPSNRRYLYPFISCAQCGPRYTITRQLPYDRIHTSFSNFLMCAQCQTEYEDPTNRRFHAQNIACPACGPRLTTPIVKIAKNLIQGEIVCLKSTGGYHLLCNAKQTKAIKRLRTIKQRMQKPFVILAGAKGLNDYCYLNQYEYSELRSAKRPILIARIKHYQDRFNLIAPEQSHLGIMMPPNPIYELLLHQIKQFHDAEPELIVTSANTMQEPIHYQDKAVEQLFLHVDLIVKHNLDIITPAEDSIVRYIAGKPRVIRRARGYLPFSLQLEPSFQHSTKGTAIATGGHFKNQPALRHGDRIELQHYIGDLDSLSSIERFETKMNHLATNNPAAPILHDCHPNYASTHFVDTLIKVNRNQSRSVQHHIAHCYSVIAEHNVAPPALCFAWDGTGFGSSNQIWGSECFLLQENQFRHCAQLKPFALLGGDVAAIEPRRNWFALLHLCNKTQLKHWFSQEEINLFSKMITNKVNTPLTSSMGRLFDAIAFALMKIDKNHFEGQAAMRLEQLAEQSLDNGDSVPAIQLLQTDELCYIDWGSIVQHVISNEHLPVSVLANHFHRWCANVIRALCDHFAIKTTVLSGGVFQNKLLCEIIQKQLQEEQIMVYFAQDIPPNDSGIAVGQLAFDYYHQASCV